MRKREFFGMDTGEAVALLAAAPVVRLASTTGEGAPVLRALHAVVMEGAIWFHAAPVGEKSEAVGRPAVFRRFAEEFAAGFGSPCGVIGPAAEVAKVVLSHSRLGVALLTLHLEWMTQAHYLDSVRDDQDLDPQFKSLLRHHWMEEAQHAKLDTLMVERLARTGGPEAIAKAFTDFAALGTAIDGLLAQQVQLDLVSLERAAGRRLAEAEKEEIVAAQTRAYRYTFLVSGLLHEKFLATVDQLNPGAAEAMRETARALS